MEKKLNKKKVIITFLIFLFIIILIIINIINVDDEHIQNYSANNMNNNENTVVEDKQINQENLKTNFQWSKDTLENKGIDETRIIDLHNRLDNTSVYTMLIIKDDIIIDEYYKTGYDENSIFTLNSCSKSITSALIGIAIDKGLIENVNIPISNYFPKVNEKNEQWRKITIWHLLTHTSGIKSTEDNWETWRESENWIDYILESPIESTPGTNFDYSTGNTHLLTAILEKATQMNAYEFGKKYLFEPLGMESVSIATDPQGITDGGNGVSMNIYDMAKFGRLFLNKGIWEGEQIISEKWIEESTTLQFERNTGSADYGYQWWVRHFGEENYDAYFAQGHFGQFIFVVPQINLIVTFTSHNTGGTSMYWEFVNTIVNACR